MKRPFIFVFIILFGIGVYITRVNPGSIVIESGDGISKIALRLSDADVIKTPSVFKIAYFLIGDGGAVYPGLVKIPEDCSMYCLVKTVLAPEHHVQRVTLLEGQDLRDLRKILEQKQIGNSSELYGLLGEPAVSGTSRKDYSEEFGFLKNVPKGVSYEGYLFPDTYEIADTATTDEIIKVFLRNFDRRVTKEMRAKASAQNRSLHETELLFPK